MTVQVTVTSDFICPWCHIGQRKLALAIARLPAEIAVEVAYRPFELNPDMPAEGMPRRQYRIAKFGSWERSQALDRQVVDAAAEVGLAFDYGRVERTPSTRLAHRLVWAAGAGGAALADRLFRAYFTEGLDLGDGAVLRELAEGAGVPAAVVASVLDGDAGAVEVQRLVDAAYGRGINGVPFFEVGGEGVSGAQPVELLEAFLRWGAEAEAAA